MNLKCVCLNTFVGCGQSLRQNLFLKLAQNATKCCNPWRSFDEEYDGVRDTLDTLANDLFKL